MTALLGWLIGRTWTASAATVLAGLVFALGPGHNIPFLGGTPATMKGVTILLIVILVSAVVLVEVEWRLRGDLVINRGQLRHRSRNLTEGGGLGQEQRFFN